MNDTFKFSDDQTFTNLSSTGEISTNIWDLEEDSVTDQMIEGCLMVKIISASAGFTGLTEGVRLNLRVDDAASLATAKNGSSAGYKAIACKEILKEEVVAGKIFAIPVCEIKTARSKYMGFWPQAVTTALVGNIHFEAYWAERPDDALKNVQKKPV